TTEDTFTRHGLPGARLCVHKQDVGGRTMKLDFSTLSRPKVSPPPLKAWGQVGTAGTATNMRASARPGSGDTAGTSGDTQPLNPTCPQASPDCPHPSTTREPNSHAVSPMSPGVPTDLK